jgi:hypothetical protein
MQTSFCLVNVLKRRMPVEDEVICGPYEETNRNYLSITARPARCHRELAKKLTERIIVKKS